MDVVDGECNADAKQLSQLVKEISNALADLWMLPV
jgi:hypothetical protein